MEKILLIEPNYKNKYPPIGLMKISTYYKSKGDFVQFHKGLLPKNDVLSFDKVLITTLFTFDFDVCIKTIKYYESIIGSNNVFIGGIASTIMPEKFLEKVPNINLLKGQLTSSNALGYNDNINIDILPLDYDILWDIDYNYPAADSYFVYTSRGCPRNCSFCAVKTLEPRFYDCENIENQILQVDENFGIKKQLLIMDNNILNSDRFEENVDILNRLGFGINNNKQKKCNNVKYYIKSLEKRISINKSYDSLIKRIKIEFQQVNTNRIKKETVDFLNVFFKCIDDNDDKKFIEELLQNKEEIIRFFDKYHYHKISRFVDFNQGLDARLFTNEKAEIMSRLSVKPCRIAFDNIETKDTYILAIETALNNNIRYFSNYLLYNYKDKPEDLWERLNININLCEKHKNDKISLFSFPMKYASITDTDRKYVGEHWCKKYLRSINVILNVSSGIVAKEKDFFERAYGRDKQEFLQILTMPDDFIRYRTFFESNRLTEVWKKEYIKLSSDDKLELINVLSKAKTDVVANEVPHSKSLNKILSFYSIKKKHVEENPTYFQRLYANK